MKREYSIVTLLLVVLSGCGGGGGSIGPVASPTPSFQITSANATTAASVAYAAALDSQQVVSLGTDGGIISSAPGVVSKVAPSGFSVPIPAETFPCAVSGTTTISGDIADIVTPTITAGDFIEVEYDVCDEGIGGILDGAVRTDFDALSGDFFTESISLTITLTFANLQLTTPVDVINTDGAVTATIDSTQLPVVSTNSRGNSLAVDRNARSDTLTNFSSSSTVNGGFNPATFTNQASGTLNSTELAGVVSYSTPVPFAGMGVDFPSSGEFLVEGSNSNLRLIAEDNVNVRIEIDLDADGTIDETINTTWAEIAQT